MGDAMKQDERDRLLIQISERLASLDREIKENVKVDIEGIERHAREQNNKLFKVIEQCASNTERSKTNYKLFCIVLGIALSGVGVGAVIANSIGLLP
jgi:hypothetical protein